MPCQEFQIGQRVRFQDSPFLRRTIGCLGRIQQALAARETFTITRAYRTGNTQFIWFVGAEACGGHRSFLNADLFRSA